VKERSGLLVMRSLERLQWEDRALTRERKKKTGSWCLRALIVGNGRGGLEVEKSVAPAVLRWWHVAT
jgi:hypothetical protein